MTHLVTVVENKAKASLLISDHMSAVLVEVSHWRLKADVYGAKGFIKGHTLTYVVHSHWVLSYIRRDSSVTAGHSERLSRKIVAN